MSELKPVSWMNTCDFNQLLEAENATYRFIPYGGSMVEVYDGGYCELVFWDDDNECIVRWP